MNQKEVERHRFKLSESGVTAKEDKTLRNKILPISRNLKKQRPCFWIVS